MVFASSRSCQPAIAAGTIERDDAKTIAAFGLQRIAAHHADEQIRLTECLPLRDQLPGEPARLTAALRPGNRIARTQDRAEVET